MTTGPSAGCGRSSAASAVDGAAGAAAARGAGAASAGRGAAAAISAPALLAANKAGPERFGRAASTGAFAGLVGAVTSTASPRRSVRFGSVCTDPARWPERSTTARMAVPRSAPNPMAMKGRGEANAPARLADEVRRAERRELTSGDTAYPHARCRRFGSPQARPSSASNSRPKWRSPLRRHYVRNRQSVALRAERGSGETRFRRAPERRMNVIISRGLGIPFRA